MKFVRFGAVLAASMIATGLVASPLAAVTPVSSSVKAIATGPAANAGQDSKTIAPMLIPVGTLRVLDQAYLSFVSANDEQQQYAMTRDDLVAAAIASPTPAGFAKSELVLSTSPPTMTDTLVAITSAVARIHCVTGKAGESV